MRRKHLSSQEVVKEGSVEELTKSVMMVSSGVDTCHLQAWKWELNSFISCSQTANSLKTEIQKCGSISQVTGHPKL
jgi:hypothetical protein